MEFKIVSKGTFLFNNIYLQRYQPNSFKYPELKKTFWNPE